MTPRARHLFFLISAAVALAVIFLFSHRPIPLVIQAFQPGFKISAACTFGTNHVYYHGDTMDRVFDPLIRRWGDTNASRLRCQTDRPSTVVWVRLEHRVFGQQPPLVATPTGPVRMPPTGAQRQFTARLTSGDSPGTMLDLRASMQHYKGSYFLAGWEVPGSLENHHGDVLHIESTNGAAVASIQIR